MIHSILLFVLLLSLVLGHYIFKRFFNPILIYSVIWFFLISLYELRLLNYIPISVQAWVMIAGSYFSFIIGIITYHAGKSRFSYSELTESHNKDFEIITYNDGSRIKYIALFFGIIGLLGAIQHWFVLLAMYGSVIEVLIHLTKIYALRVSGELEGVIPYLGVASYISVFFAGIYTAYKGKFTLISILPFAAIIIKGVASVGRQGILYGFVEYITTYLVFRYYLAGKNLSTKKFNFSLIATIAILSSLLFLSVLFIRDFRGNDETYTGETRQIQQFKDNPVLTPSIYLYLSAHLGVLTKYIEMNEEEARFGENSLQFFYNIIKKVGLVDKVNQYQRGYFVPTWTNTGTYLRELHADFGYIGVYLVPYLIGFFIALNWFNYFRSGNLINLVMIVHLSIIIWFSFLMMITRGANWFLSIFIISIILHFLRILNPNEENIIESE